MRRLNWKNPSGKTYPDPSGFETSILMFCPLQITSILPVWPTPCCNESWMTSQVPNVISSVGDQNIFKKYFYWAFPIHLITMLRTESELELSPLRGKCCQALLLHQRTYTSSGDSPQPKRYSAHVESNSLYKRGLYSSNHPSVLAS